MMKKVFTMVLALVFPVAAWSADGDTFTYNTAEGVSLVYTVISEANKTCITGIQTSLPVQGTVTVPSEANGYKVIGVGYRTFRNFAIAKVILPSTITYISEEAFEGCGKLASINIPNGVTTIYRQAFKDCSSLSSIKIPGTVKQWESECFRECTGLTSVTLEEGVETVGYGAFSGCTALSSISIPGTVKLLNTRCFLNCTGLTSVTLEEGVETIGDAAFSGCTALSSISFPSTISTIYSSSFNSTAWLTNLPTGLTYVGNIAFKYKSPASGSAVIIKNGTTKIQAGAFSGSNITSITFPIDGKFKEIGPNAFGNCKGLETLLLPASITSIGDNAFEYCDNLATITVEHTTPLAISPRTFSNQEKTLLKVPEGSKEAYLKAEVWKEFLIKQPSDPEKFSGGSGTESDPYLISTPGDMKELSVDVNSGNSYDGKYFKVTKPEIDFTGFNYTPIGRQESMPFSGIFDGQNTLIKGITINIEDNYLKYYNSIGIFGYLGKNAHVSNISIDESCTFQGTYDVGGIAGVSKGLISNCINKGSIIASKNRIGGICGDNMGIIEKCSNYGSVSTTNPVPGMIGGIAGDCDSGTIQNCTNYGKVSAKDSEVGGIVGLTLSGNTGKAIIEGCTNKGDVEGSYDTGGIVGRISSSSKNTTIKNCLVSGCTIKSNGTEYKDAGAICNNGNAILSENYYTPDVIVIEGSNTYSGLMARGISGNQNVVEDNGAMPRIVFNELFAQNDEGQYEIQSVNNMILLRDLVNEADNSCEGLTFKVTAKELNFNNQSFTIGIYLYQMYTENGITHNKTYKPFAGTFDGNGVLIKNLALKNDSYNKYYGLGLFAYNKGVIKNVTIDESCTISSQSLYLGGIVAVNDGVIEGCINKASISGYNYVGGIAGTSSVKIQGCTNSGTISGSDNIGGIVGRNSGEVFECENANTVNIASTNNSGGGITAVNSGTVRGCSNNGNITAKRPSPYNSSQNKSIAGIAGINSAGGTLVDNIVLGGVFTDASGAVVGTNAGTLQNNLYTSNVSGVDYGSCSGDKYDNFGAVKGNSIIAGKNVKIVNATSENGGLILYNNIPYASEGLTINLTLEYEGEIPENYDVEYCSLGYTIMKNEDGTYPIYVSYYDRTIDATLVEKPAPNLEYGEIKPDELGVTGEGTVLAAGTVLCETQNIVCKTGAEDTYRPQPVQVSIDGVEISGGIQGNTNPHDEDGGTPATTLKQPTSGAFLQFEAKADGFLYVAINASSNKAYTVFENGTAIGYAFSAIGNQNPLPEVYSYTLTGTGEQNQLLRPIGFAEQEYLRVANPEAYEACWTMENDVRVWNAINASGTGVIAFPVHNGSSYIVNANGSKISAGGYYFDETNEATVKSGDVTIFTKDTWTQNIIDKTLVAIPESTIIPWGTEQAWEMKYVYFDEIGNTPANDGAGRAWTDAEFDDSGWQTLTGPIARYESDFSVVNTIWEKENSCYYLRRTFNLDEVNEQGYYFCSQHDDNVKVWINGTQVVEAGYNGRCQYYHIPASAFVEGTNTLAIYLDDTGGGANLDYCMANFYLLKNVETGKYLNAGDEWRAVLADEGLPVKLNKQSDGSYTIYFPFGSRNQQLLYRTGEEGVYVDYSRDWAPYGACPSWTFTDAGEGRIYIQTLTTHPTYGQEAMPGTYMGNNPSSNFVDGNITVGNNITWTVEALPARTEAQTARLQELVTAANALGLDTTGEEAVLNNNEVTYIDMLTTIYELQNRINDEYNNVNAKAQDLNKLIACAAAIGVSTSDAQAVADNPQNMESVNYAISTLRTTYIAKLGEGVDASLLPLDVTGAIINPTFATNEADGWSWNDGEDGPGFGFTTAEYRERTFDFHQTVSGLPNGSYLLKVKGFHRPGNKDDVFADYMQGTDNAKAKFYANGKSVTLKNAAAEAQEHEVDGWSGLDVTYNGQTRYIPHENYDANTWFLAGYYENELSFTVTDGTLTFGVSLDESVKDDWVCFDDFRLILSDNAIDVSQLPNAIYVDDQTGNVDCKFTMDIKLKNEKPVRAYSFDLQLPEGVTIVKDANDDYEMELSGRHDSYAPTVNYVGNNIYKFATTSRVVGNDGVIMTLRLQVSKQMPLGEYFIRILNATYTQADTYESVNMPETTAKLTIGEKDYIKGDVNDDDDIDIADVVCVVNHVVKLPTPENFVLNAANVNGDDKVDISDAAMMVDYIIGEIDALGPIAATVRRLALSRSLNDGVKTGILDVSTLNDALYANDLNVEPGKNALLTISLKNTETTNGYSFDLILPDGVTLAKDGNNKYLCELSSRHDKTHGVNIKYKEDTRTYSVLVYSQSSKSLSGNDGEVLTFTLAVTNALGNNATLSIQNCKYSLTSGAASVPLPREEVKLNKGPKGDADGNGKINMSDVIIMLSYILGENPENFNIYAADMNSDGKVTVTDVLLMYGLIP